MNIAYYCQHVLGIGHFHRSLAICSQLASAHRVTMILGGPDTPVEDPAIEVFRLPGLQMDSDFKNLAPCNPSEGPLDTVKERRKEMLFNWFQEHQPDIFIVELYPFGRKAFRFELDPVLNGIKEHALAPCRTFVSLRDILVERPDDREKFEARVVKTLNKWFDGLLIHADGQAVQLEETFSRTADIRIPARYTGFITRDGGRRDRTDLRKELGIDKGCRLITVSIGGGNVGGELLDAAVAAFRQLDSRLCRLQLFAGLYCPDDHYNTLEHDLPQGARITRFSDRFPDWLLAADLSISMAGYNTSMNLLSAGVPAIIYPFRQNREQRYRMEKLSPFGTFRVIEAEELEPERLAAIMRENLHLPRYETPLRLDGAEQTRILIEQFMDDMGEAR